MPRQRIRDFRGITLGFIETKPNGHKIATDFYGRKLGEYYPGPDVTRDFYGKIIARGDATAMLIQLGYKSKPDLK